MPVSSSRLTKTIPLAVCGRWRMMTSPATSTREPAGSRASSRAVRIRREASAGRSIAIGCARSDRPVVA